MTFTGEKKGTSQIGIPRGVNKVTDSDIMHDWLLIYMYNKIHR